MSDTESGTGGIVAIASSLSGVTAIIVAGGFIIFGVLWFLAYHTPVTVDVIDLFIPLTLVWTGLCIFWHHKQKQAKNKLE